MQSLFIGLLTSTLMLLNTVIGMIPLTLMALLKAVVPVPVFRKCCSAAIVWIAESWAEMCKRIFAFTTPTHWDIRGTDGLDSRKSYMIISNHQSWVDIPALIQTFNKRIPYFKFFLKKELVGAVAGACLVGVRLPFYEAVFESIFKKISSSKGG